MREGILLVNLGTPDAPTPKAIRRYLGEFLADRRVVEIPRLIWLPLLYGLILPLRARRVARNYASIWLDRGSPLRVHTEDLAEVLADRTGLPVSAAFRYGQPSLAQGLDRLRDQGCSMITVLPLYPQFSATTTATVLDGVAAVFAKRRSCPSLRFVSEYHVHPPYIRALADSIRQHWQVHGRAERLLMSFHGLPQRNVDLGDPYADQCRATAEAVAAELELADDDWALSFQSRFGKQIWLQPYTEPLLVHWARTGIKAVDVVCPGFAADCLETLEEIAQQARDAFVEAGGESLRYVPALNSSAEHADALAALLKTRPAVT